jgi:hypothetical protein
MSTENWKESVKSQQTDLERLQAIDAALNDHKITSDIEKILRKQNSKQAKNFSSGNPLRDINPLRDASNPLRDNVNLSRDSGNVSRENSFPPPPSNYENVEDNDDKDFNEPGYDDIYKSDANDSLFYQDEEPQKTPTNTKRHSIGATSAGRDVGKASTGAVADSNSHAGSSLISPSKAPETSNR